MELDAEYFSVAEGGIVEEGVAHFDVAMSAASPVARRDGDGIAGRPGFEYVEMDVAEGAKPLAGRTCPPRRAPRRCQRRCPLLLWSARCRRPTRCHDCELSAARRFELLPHDLHVLLRHRPPSIARPGLLWGGSPFGGSVGDEVARAECQNQGGQGRGLGDSAAHIPEADDAGIRRFAARISASDGTRTRDLRRDRPAL